MNTSDLPAGPFWAERRVLEIQARLHRWASDDPHRRFDDLYNLVADPGFLMMAWDRVAGNKGARSAGVNGQTAASVREQIGRDAFLADLREQLKSRRFRPLPVRERMIPKPGTRKRRRLGIPTVADRVVQASLKLVLEPIFEADFVPCSYGSGLAGVRMTRSPRAVSWHPRPMSGCWKAISRRASTRSRTQP